MNDLRHGDRCLLLPQGTLCTVYACWYSTAQVSVETEEGTRCFIVLKENLLLVERAEFSFKEAL